MRITPSGGDSAVGRDYFLGGQLIFNDEDLKALLAVGGSALGGALLVGAAAGGRAWDALSLVLLPWVR